MNEELWLPVEGFDGYAISDQGRVLSLKGETPLLMKIQTSEDGYSTVNLYRDGKQHKCTVHVLMLETFVGPRPEGLDGCHFDDDGTNNVLTNLRWDTRKSNSDDRIRNRPACPAGHEYTEQNTYEFTRKDGRRERHCRKCRRDRWREKHGKTGRLNSTRYNPDRIA